MATFCWVTRPSTNGDDPYAAALRFGEQRVMAILSALVGIARHTNVTKFFSLV